MRMDVMGADTLIPSECAHLLPWRGLRAAFIWTGRGSKHIFLPTNLSKLYLSGSHAVPTTERSFYFHILLISTYRTKMFYQDGEQGRRGHLSACPLSAGEATLLQAESDTGFGSDGQEAVILCFVDSRALERQYVGCRFAVRRGGSCHFRCPCDWVFSGLTLSFWGTSRKSADAFGGGRVADPGVRIVGRGRARSGRFSAPIRGAVRRRFPRAAYDAPRGAQSHPRQR